MSEAVKRVVSLLTYSEERALLGVVLALNGKREATVVVSALADGQGITKSIYVIMLRLLEAAGVIETRSLGMKGLHIKVLDDSLLAVHKAA